jgi:hypothetical protein
MLATGLPRATVLDVIQIPYNIRSDDISVTDRALLIEGFVRGFQVAFYVAGATMAAATAAVFVLVKQINLDQAHRKADLAPMSE